MTAWRAEERDVQRIETLDVGGLARCLDGDGGPAVLDVRGAEEFAAGHIPGSLHVPYEQLGERLPELPRDRPIAAICKAGKRSGLAASILQREGFDDVMHVSRGGVGAWRAAGHPIETG